MAENITVCVQDFIIKARRVLKEKFDEPSVTISVGSHRILVALNKDYAFGFADENEKRAQIALQSLFNGEPTMSFSYTGGQYDEGYGVDKESADMALRKTMNIINWIRKIRDSNSH
jgi:esterase/lipase superfamily enzyme